MSYSFVRPAWLLRACDFSIPGVGEIATTKLEPSFLSKPQHVNFQVHDTLGDVHLKGVL